MILTVTSQSVLRSESPIFCGLLHSQDLHKEEDTMVFEAHDVTKPVISGNHYIYSNTFTKYGT